MSGPKDDGRLFVGGISWKADEKALGDFFAQFGKITECRIIKDKNTGRSKGYAFITFEDPANADKVRSIGNVEFLGKMMNIGEATPRRDDDGKPAQQQTNQQQQHRGQKRDRDREYTHDRDRRDDREYKDRDRERDKRDKGGDRSKGNFQNQQMPQAQYGQAGIQAPQLPFMLNPSLQALALNPLLLSALQAGSLPPPTTDQSSYQHTWQPMGPGTTGPSTSYSQPNPSSYSQPNPSPASSAAPNAALNVLLQQLQSQQLQALQQLQAQQISQPPQANHSLQNSGMAQPAQFSNLLQQLQALQKK